MASKKDRAAVLIEDPATSLGERRRVPRPLVKLQLQDRRENLSNSKGSVD